MSLLVVADNPSIDEEWHLDDLVVSRGANPSVLTHAGARLAWIGVAPRVKVLNTLGAGDAMLAGAAFGIL